MTSFLTKSIAMPAGVSEASSVSFLKIETNPVIIAQFLMHSDFNSSSERLGIRFNIPSTNKAKVAFALFSNSGKSGK
ncbi:uncharacterized protein METZ01_LOCUS353922 [marine metagenome]|uniref:Uncharacterized protein n=1 Tax=marine metagenome TaxID=408172 RepID=A0A382RVW0_9ZZZZ